MSLHEPKKTHVLVLGAEGQLGQTLQALWAHDPMLQVVFWGRHDFDLTQELEDMAQKLSSLPDTPHVLVNAAAYTAVDRAESEPDAAHAVNAQGPERLGRLCAQHDIMLLHVSSDYVFEGTSCRPYQEDDLAHPQQVYGASKRAGEQAVLDQQALGLKAWILRVSWLYGPWGHNFVTTIQRLMAEKKQLSLVCDQISAPTSTLTLARVLRFLIQDHTQKPQAPHPGVSLLHVCDQGYASWYDLAAAVQRHPNMPPQVRDCALHPIPSEGYPLPAKRPFCSWMNTQKLRDRVPFSMLHWQDALHEVLSWHVQDQKHDVNPNKES